MHLLALLQALPRPSNPNPLFSERRAIRDAGLCVCMGGWAESPSLARTVDSQMETHGLPQGHRVHLTVYGDPGKTLRFRVYKRSHKCTMQPFPGARVGHRDSQGAWLSRTIPPCSLDLGGLDHFGAQGARWEASYPPHTFPHCPERCRVNSSGIP